MDLVESAVAKIETLPSHAVNDTRTLRLAPAREFYAHPEHIDCRRLGLLEIFEGSSYRNLTENPLASVLRTGTSPVFVSFQADFVVEIITPEEPRYRFFWSMRRLSSMSRSMSFRPCICTPIASGFTNTRTRHPNEDIRESEATTLSMTATGS